MISLGINLTHDGTICVLENGKNKFSIAEERLNRIKCYVGFPFLGLQYIIDNKIIDPRKIDCVSIASSRFPKIWAYTFAFQLTKNKLYYDLQNQNQPNNFFIDDRSYLNIKNEEDCKNYVTSKIQNLLSNVGIKSRINFVDHHLSHAAAAYYSSGHKKALAITLDGEGDFLSATVNICNDGIIKKISENSMENSLGYLYSEVTRACGFKVSRHEGKITGLAAYGDYKKYENCFEKLVTVKNGNLLYVNPVKRTLINRALNKVLSIFGSQKYLGAQELIKRCGKLSNEDLAASIQNLLEKKIVQIVSYWVNKTGIENVILSGGVFANVKFNQYISEIKQIRNLYIYPNMGDGGNAYGAAAHTYFKTNKFKLNKIKHIYLGNQFDNNQVNTILTKHRDKIDFHLSKDICSETAKLIANNKIIGWFQGKMEYGPRALGNRSIIASPTDQTINKWLNKRMKRTEFMPFAPSCLYEYADELFDIPNENLKFPAQFMTITFHMKKEWAIRAPAVSHIDQTARPQLVTKEANEKYYRLLDQYRLVTGLPLFINTSFNIHEEPIVCRPEEAIKSLFTEVIDYLCIGDYICKLK